jgi:Na+-driven multidrug efflux pump
MAANSLCQLWFLGVINRLGPTATAAHGVAIRCEAVAFLTISAFSVAASTLTGQFLGARRPDLAARAARTAWGLGAAVLTALGVILALGAEPLFGLFLGSGGTEVARLGAPLLRIVAFAMPCLATISVLGGALRGAGDTRWPLAIVLAGYLLVRMPLAYTLTAPGGADLGLIGAWIAMLADLALRAALIAGRFGHGGWRHVRV